MSESTEAENFRKSQKINALALPKLMLLALPNRELAAYHPREYIRPDPRPGSMVLPSHFR